MVKVKTDGRRLLCGVALLAVVGMVTGMTRGAIVEYTVDCPVEVDPGEQFQVCVYVDDLRDEGASGGVFAAYADLIYNPDIVDWVSGTLVVDPFFGNGQSGTIDEPGQIVDEAGGFNGFTPPGSDPAQLLFSITVQAHASVTTPTVVTFSLNEADDSPTHDTLVFGSNDPVTDLAFGACQTTVTPEPASLCLLALGGIVALRRRRS